MVAIIITLALGFTGVMAAAVIAGSAEKRKIALRWSASGMAWATATAVTIFFQKAAVKEIILKKYPQLPALNIKFSIPSHVMLQFGLTAFVCGIIAFLLAYNCRKNSAAWYRAILWCLGMVFYIGHILFLPQYYGIAVFVKLAAPQSDLKFLDTILPFYLMLIVLLSSALLWTWHTLKTARHSMKNILVYAGCFTVFALLLYLPAWGIGTWAKGAIVDKAAKYNISPSRVPADESPELKALVSHDFYTRYPKYNPPRAGKYDWSKDEIPADEKAFTMKFFTSPELENHLADLKKASAYLARKDVLYMSPMQYFRSLVRHRADIAELYYRTNQKDKVLPELLKYPELESFIPADTPFLICELVRSATRWLWVNALVQFGPEDKFHLPTYEKLLAWSKTWQVHLPCEAGVFLTVPEENHKNAVAAFFYTPYQNVARYRKFSNAAGRIPALNKLEQQEVISENSVFANAARRQRLTLVMGQTALALKVYKIEHGKYPQKLSELVPRYLAKEYVSPDTGKKLAYSVKEYAVNATEGTEFTLSSGKNSITSKK